MSRNLLSKDTLRLLRNDRVKIYAFFGIKRNDEGPFFFAGVAPADEDTPIFAHGLVYARAEGATPDEAVDAFRQKIWNGL